MQGDNDYGSFSTDELARLEAAGVIEIHQPGTADADAFDRAMVVDLDAYDDEHGERDGPVARTSERLLRQTVVAAEQNPALLGYRFAAYRNRHGWSREQFADWLGLSAVGLAGLALEVEEADACVLAAMYGANPGRLAAVIAT